MTTQRHTCLDRDNNVHNVVNCSTWCICYHHGGTSRQRAREENLQQRHQISSKIGMCIMAEKIWDDFVVKIYMCVCVCGFM